MPDGGTLTISGENLHLDEHYAALFPEAVPGSYVMVRVEDSGSGMAPKVLEQIFDPFFTTKAIGQGTGLGLSTSLAIVKSHGGFIRVKSLVGRGTTFEVYLRAPAEAVAAAEAEKAVELPRGHGELLLVVDDETGVREITQRTLENFGYRVLLAADGAKAVAVFAARRAEIAAVITDMTMPVMDGIATIRVLREMKPDLLVIGASGLPPDAQLTGLGVAHFLSKPYTGEDLLKIVSLALRK
jgi:CheY-like chemotaxis protein